MICPKTPKLAACYFNFETDNHWFSTLSKHIFFSSHFEIDHYCSVLKKLRIRFSAQGIRILPAMISVDTNNSLLLNV